MLFISLSVDIILKCSVILVIIPSSCFLLRQAVTVFGLKLSSLTIMRQLIRYDSVPYFFEQVLYLFSLMQSLVLMNFRCLKNVLFFLLVIFLMREIVYLMRIILCSSLELDPLIRKRWAVIITSKYQVDLSVNLHISIGCLAKLLES